MNSLVIDDVLKSRDDNGADVLELRYFVQSVGEPVLTVLQLGGKLEKNTFEVLVASFQIGVTNDC